jgi:hypothetical protein
MAKPTIVTRAGKGSALTWTEGDSNLTNLRDATISVTDGTNTASLNLNDTLTLTAGSNITLSVNASTDTITISSSSGSSFDPASPGTIGGTTPGAATFSSVYVKGGVGTLRLYNAAGSAYVGLYAGTSVSSHLYQLPDNLPSATNQSLLSDTSGIMSWGYPTIDLSNSPGPIGTAAGANAAKFTTLTFNTTRDIVYTSGSTTGTITPNAANGSVQKITLTGSITFSAFASPLSGQTLTLIITQPASGGPYTLTSTMKFSGASKTLSTAANAVDIMTVFYDGTTYWASLAKGFA